MGESTIETKTAELGCDVCGKPPLYFTYDTSGNWSTPQTQHSYCEEHAPPLRPVKLGRRVATPELRDFLRAVADGWPNEDAPEHVRAIFIAALRSEARRLLAPAP